MLDPTTKNRIVPDGDKLAAIGAHAANAIYGVTAAPWMNELYKTGQAPIWWCSQLGQPTTGTAHGLGAAQHGARIDVVGRRRRSHRDAEPGSEHQERISGLRGGRADAGRAERHVGLHQLGARRHARRRSSSKGILNGEDAAAAVKYGADAIIVSNHGGRALRRRDSQPHGAARVR